MVNSIRGINKPPGKIWLIDYSPRAVASPFLHLFDESDESASCKQFYLFQM